MILEIALILLAGSAVLSASWTLHQMTGLPAAALDLPFLVGVVALVWRRPQRSSNAHGRILFIAAAAISAAALAAHMVRFPDGGNDAFIIWNLRARWMYRDFNSAFSTEILFWTHQDYPLLLPGLVARGFALLGHESRVVPAVIAIFYTACAVAIVAARSWWAGLALVTTPALVMLGATEQADLPLAAFVGAAVVLLVRNRDARDLAAAGAFASMAAWTKNEGLLHLLLLGAAVLLTHGRRVLVFIAGAAPFLVLLALFKIHYAPPNDLMQSVSFARAVSFDRWWTLLLLALRRIVLLQAWGLHLLALVLWAIFVRGASAAPPHVRWLSWFPLATIAVHLCILLAQPHDLTFMFKVTIDRLILQVWPAIILLIACREPGVLSSASWNTPRSPVGTPST